MTMTRIILVYGTIAGIVLAISLVFAVTIGMEAGVWGMAFGYLSMLIALSMVFVGVKRYRDEVLGGVIGFWPALGLGLGIALFASLFYVFGWEIYLALTGYTFAADYVAAMIEAEREAGASPAEVAAMQAEYAPFVEQYADPLVRIPLTFTELAPIVLLVTLLTAILLRNPRFMPREAGVG